MQGAGGFWCIRAWRDCSRNSWPRFRGVRSNYGRSPLVDNRQNPRFIASPHWCRGSHRSRALPRCLSRVLGDCDHQPPDAREGPLPADGDAQLLAERSTGFRPHLPAARGLLRPHAGSARLLSPLVGHASTPRPPRAHRRSPGSGCLPRPCPRTGRRHPGAGLLPAEPLHRHQCRRSPDRARQLLVDDSCAAALGAPRRGERGGHRDRIPLRAAR